LFEKQWKSIVGNCDEFLYLGGNEQSTHKYVSELLGKETIDTNTFGKSMGRNGNYSTNYQITGRELLYCIVTSSVALIQILRTGT
jgi:type IV secretion system protein VirD4